MNSFAKSLPLCFKQVPIVSFIQRSSFHSSIINFAGHSAFKNIKHRKQAQDAKKAQIFLKIGREITTAVRLGGKDPNFNSKLMSALSYARGPGGVAFLVESLTNNKNRSSQFIRGTFNKHGGSLSSAGEVAWIFEKKGFISLKHNNKTEEEIMEIAMESGAEDFEYGVGEKKDETNIICARNDLIKVKNALEGKGMTIANAQIISVPNQTVSQMESESEEQFNLLLDSLDDLEDVSRVYHNFQPSQSE